MKQPLETGHEKISKICNILRQKTLEPAKEEAHNILEKAQRHAEEIVRDAQRHADKLLEDTRQSIEQERNVFHSSLSQATKQSLEALRQAIEHKLFNEELHQLVVQHTTDPKVIANFITALVKAIDKEGLDANLIALIPATIPVKDVNTLLGKEILNKLKDHSVQLGDFLGGAKIRLENKRLTFDISDVEIEDLLKRYVRKDFRKLLFANHE